MIPRIAGVCVIWLLVGCNLFSPLASDSQKELTYRGLILEGNAAINEGDFAQAEILFAQAKQMNPRGSEAYLYHSKALANIYRIDYDTLNKEFNSRRNLTGKGKKGIPFIDANTTIEKIDSTYYPVAQSVENLEHILRHKRDTLQLRGGYVMLPDGDTASDGKISEGVARLDLGLLQTIKGMLGPLDLDGNNRINRSCGLNICPSADPACMATAAYRQKCKDGLVSEVNGFTSFKLLTSGIDINNVDPNDVRARQVSINPNEINAFLDKMQGPIAASSYNLDSVTSALETHNEAKLSGQFSDIVTTITDLSDFLSYMRFDDGIDNDFDNQNSSGKGTPFIWHDYDKDGGIHFNYDDDVSMAGYLGADTTEKARIINGLGRNIGHPLHRFLHPELYIKFTDSAFIKRPIAIAKSENARKAKMIEYCISVSENLIVDGKVTQGLKDTLINATCSTFSPILKSTVTPPVRSEWVGGTFGIDEEMIDDKDNDNDGIKDEDARNTPGMDDDDDAQYSASMVGTNLERMVWQDAPGHDNLCPDIDVNQPMLPSPFSRQFCIGALEHRLYLLQQWGKDTLAAHYQIFTGEGPSSNCLEDFDKLPQSYKDKVGLPSSEDPIVLLACQYKHIWKKSIPPNSEWKSGIFGLDEEIADGADNDGDGWVDEDLK